MSEPSTVMAPVQPTQRIETIDILRGFTLLGILLANMAFFSIPMAIRFQGPNYWTDPIDKAAQLLIMLFAVGEFYVPFSFFFGWGLAVQMGRATARGARYVPLYLRRILVLFLMGLAHSILLWYGDVLATYAVLGLPLILWRKLSNRVILATAVVCLLIPSLLYLPGPSADLLQNYNQAVVGIRQEAGAGEQAGVYAQGDYVEITAQRVKDVKSYWTGLIIWGPHVLALMLLGLYVGRRGILRNIPAHLSLFRKAMWLGLLVGLPLTAAYVLMSLSPDRVPPDWWPFVRRTTRTFGGLGLCLFYLSAIILLVQRESWRERLLPLAPVGRMTLTNYLIQSLICTTIFYGYGLALYGRVGPAINLILAALIFAFQIKFSAWWLDRYRFGPMEWLWRTLTYLKPQPMRLEGDEGVSRRTWITLAGTITLVVAGAFGWWWTNQGNGPPAVAIQLPQLQPTAQPTAPPQPTPSPSPTPIGTPVVSPVIRTPGPAAAQGNLWALGTAFDEERAFAEIETLTGSPYRGRQAGSPQAHAAGAYIAQRFAEYGLQPAGVDGTYFQPFPVLYTTLTETPELIVTGPGGATHEYAFRQDYATIVRYYAGSGEAEGPVIWVHDGRHADYDGVDAVGKVVLCREHGEEDQARNALEHGAVGLLLLTDPAARPLDRIGPYRDVWVPVPIPALRVSPTVAQDLLAGSGLTLDDLTIRFDSYPLSTTARLVVALRTDEAARGRNVLGVLPGRDPAYADQVVIIGGHYDHMGQDPDGTAWVGANDNASGVAVLLEIARSWQEQGYVPRRTVLFGAWDAEEMGLVGSRYYVAHPQYPLTATVGMIQLDMVGAGADIISIDGTDPLASQLAATAHTLGISTTVTQAGRSDHAPFMKAGVPADLLIWFGPPDGSAVPHYHRPADVPAVIEPDRLAGAGRITDLSTLALVEGEPAIADLLRARAAAVMNDDEAAYLRTSPPARQAADRTQFAALRALAPVRYDVVTANPIVVGRVATSTVRMSVDYVVTTSVTATRSAGLPVRFTHDDAAGWVWDGPALVWEPASDDGGFPVAHPPGQDVDDLGRVTASRYVTVTTPLSLPTSIDAAILLYSSQQALWADTTFPDPSNGEVWIGTDGSQYQIRQVAGNPVLTDTLIHLAMTRAGVTEATAPWLWRGLPLAMNAAADPVAAQSRYLPQLEEGLLSTEADAQVPRDVADWAAIDYLQRRVGWEGIGRLITTLGRGQSLEDALASAVGTDVAGFETAWRADWTQRLTHARAGLAALLDARQSAVLAGDAAAFERTVDLADPMLLAEERAWFADLADHPAENFTLEGQPLALLDDGSLLADVTMRYQLAGERERTVPLTVRLTPALREAGYRWAGSHWDTLRGEHVTIRYPAGQEQLARDLLPDAEAACVYPEGFAPAAPPTIKLYDDARAFRSSIRLSLPTGVEAWTGPGESIKLLTSALEARASRRRVVAREVTRRLLFEMGNQPEWLREGLALAEAGRLDPADARYVAARYRPTVVAAAQRERLFPLNAMPAFLSLSGEERDRAYAQSWDAARYLVDTYGWERVGQMLRDLERGQSVDDAFRAALGRSLTEFESAWRESAARGHADPAWVETAWQFDEDAANAHVVELASPFYAGRQAGSPGTKAAAQYVAEKFAFYGLTPVGGDGTFFQHVPISYTTLLATPRLTLVDQRGQRMDELGYRQEFLPVLRDKAGGGTVESDLVWVRDPTYGGMHLDGKVVLRQPESGLADEIRLAVEHGAGGLILLGNREGDRLWAKDPLPVSAPPTYTIPVLEVNEAGLDRLLTAGGHTLGELNNSPPALPLDLRVRMEVPLSSPITVSTTNVLGLLPGSDPARRHEVVIVGAHYDHVGDDPGRARYPGANDDASGVGVLLEIARLSTGRCAWQQAGYRPARSVLFAAWGAQEPGEVGSSFYVAHPTFPLTDTVAMFQLDAVGGGFAGFRLQAQGNRQREAWPLFALEAAADQVEGRLILGKPVGRSDHRPFQEAGVPAVLLVWKGASEENLPAGFVDEVDPYKLGVTGRTVALALMMLAR